MWPDLIAKSKEGGADVVQTYVFWSGHEPVKGQVCYIISLSLCVFSLISILCEVKGGNFGM